MSETPNNGKYPVLPVRNTVLFPSTTVPLLVGRPRSLAALDYAKKHGDLIFVVAQKHSSNSNEPTLEDLYFVGTLCRIEKRVGSSKEGYQILVQVLSKAHVKSYESGDVLMADVETSQILSDIESKTEKALLTTAKQLAKEILELVPAPTDSLSSLVDGIDDLGYLSYLCVSNLDLSVAKKQEFLEMNSLKALSLELLSAMQGMKENLMLQHEIRSKVSHKMGQSQREAILREQLATIREELGEGKDSHKTYSEKIEQASMPEDVKKIALDELDRLDTMSQQSPEYHVIRNYLDLLCVLPWNKVGESKVDLEKAKATLEEDHFGMEKVKKRILQHLAVLQLTKNKKGTILLFVGPPGVGKTSLGQSIARALNRKFMRMSLGGLRDDAEIRGHRRTYIGSMPGKIIQSIKRVGERNPVLLLDEVDKLSVSFHGDPAAALLEVLDPEQNHQFMDHYLDVPFDLSQVMFIATANTLDTIPRPLLDRMEVVDLSGYTSAEKLHIAKKHLIPKLLEEHGISPDGVCITEEAILKAITRYTREAGVRELKRVLASVCRELSSQVASGTSKKIKVKGSDLESMLGPEKYLSEVAERIAPPGVVTGLAWTPVGGDILFIESSAMAGKNQLLLTGQLGAVMKESAQIGLSLVRSFASNLSAPFDFEKSDIHIHVPAGAIPKDGPSAGVTMVTSLASLITKKSVDPKLAMTGEISLRGLVMPVGGIKEKLVAAHRAGIQKVILPKKNEKDLFEVPEEVKSQLKIIFVENVTQLLQHALDIKISLALAKPEVPSSQVQPTNH